MDREGEYVYSLRPRTRTGTSRLMCEVIMKDNIKIVTLRSTYKVENQTFYPLEITLVDDTGHPVYPIEKIGMLQSNCLRNTMSQQPCSSGSRLCNTNRGRDTE